jgi:RNA-directed DNA polymerase
VPKNFKEGNMSPTAIGKSMSPELVKVMERATRDPDTRFSSLAHLIDVEALLRAFEDIREEAAVGVDGVTKEQYEQDLEGNLQRLHQRMKEGRWRHQPIRRVHLPKEGGKTRPIGISTTEDKVVQGALKEVLEAAYEPSFVEGSYGFRPGRGAHDALRAVDQMVMREGTQWIYEADIQSFFDDVDRKRLKEMLEIRVADGSLMRLVGKCLHVGVLDGEEFSQPDQGTAQGSIISPLLGNIYLHYALDQWFEKEVKPRLAGQARLIRYADDFVVGCQKKEDAERIGEWLPKRLAEYGLTLNPDKTRLLDFRRPSRGQAGGKGPGTFDFLGFTLYWRKTRKGGWVLGMKTRKGRLRRAIKALGDFCRSHRHETREEQHQSLSRRLQGHYNYFGVNGNFRSLAYLRQQAERVWHKWLDRRSQRRRLTWQRFKGYLKAFPLPAPRIRVQIWGT